MSTKQNAGRVVRHRRGHGSRPARRRTRLALLARRADRIEALAAELGDGAIAIAADVTDRDSIVAAAGRVQDELGGADILINNAGVMLLAPFSSEQQAESRQMVEVNLLGAMTATEVDDRDRGVPRSSPRRGGDTQQEREACLNRRRPPRRS
jgi:NAD(P)-dependent dehydrogenase (short-subunit alcohol dehydrogenase family)